MARTRTPDYKVGYKKPPRHTRFKPGQSGNPAGRPKRTPKPPPPANLSEEHAQTLRLLSEEVTWGEDGLTRRVTSGEAMQRALIRQAMAGDVRAIKLVQEQEARARAALDAIRVAAHGVDTAALTLLLAKHMRSQTLGEADTSRPGSDGEADAARPVEHQPSPALPEEEGMRAPADQLDQGRSEPAAPPAPRKQVAGRVQGGPENSPQEIEADIRATLARETTPPSHDTRPVFGNRQPCASPGPTLRRRRPSNEPLIRDTRPLTY
jgi:hypothetical protein